MLKVSHEFSGFGDYWGGNGRRWDNDAGCLFAHYDGRTTLRDCVDQWCDDFCMGGDCDSFPADISKNELRAAILDSLTEQGRRDYENDALAECAVEYNAINGPPVCRDCGAELGCDHEEDCDGFDDEWNEVTEDDCDDCDDCCESPVWIILVEVDVCE